MSVLLTLIAIVVALPGAFAALHLTLLTVAALAYRNPEPAGPVPPVRFRVVIPAHNEEAVIAATLEATQRQLRPGDSILVVADGCTDGTADIARAHGATVLDRGSTRVAGRAAARQSGVDHALGSDDWDAICFLDADSCIDEGFFDHCERMLALGARALQGRSEAALQPGLISAGYIAAFALQGITIPRGRDRLGLSVRLRGTGMIILREVAGEHRFSSPASEDLFYSLDLCLDGVLPRHVDRARLRSESVRSWSAAGNQRLRYEAGRMSAARLYLGQLLRLHSRASLEAAWHLATPPLAVATGLLIAGAGFAALAGSWWLVWTALALVGCFGFDVATGLILARAPLRAWLALITAPWYVAWKMWVQVRAAMSVHGRQRDYGPTPRT